MVPYPSNGTAGLYNYVDKKQTKNLLTIAQKVDSRNNSRSLTPEY